jgi:hypothetical protein
MSGGEPIPTHGIDRALAWSGSVARERGERDRADIEI